MSSILGYIVQQLDEDSIVPFEGPKKLHTVFSEALRVANSLYTSYMDAYPEEDYGPYEIYKPSKKQADEQGTVPVFKGSMYHVSITCITK